jgi:hypothetical protein
MVYFQTKNINLGKFGRALDRKLFREGAEHEGTPLTKKRTIVAISKKVMTTNAEVVNTF